MLTTDGSLPQQLGVVWSRLLEADSEGPSFISHAACARSVSSSRTFLSCACGALSMTQGRFRMLLMHHVDLPSTLIDARLAETVQRNLSVYGHGIKGFVLSMVETAIAVTDGRIPAQDIQTILSFGRTLLEHPVELVEGAREVLESLRARDHELWLIADEDVFDQESKIA